MNMDIRTTLVAPSLTAKPGPTGLNNWMVGQLITATVVEKRPDNSLLLQVKNEFIEARAQQQLPVKAGDTLALQVQKNGNPGLLKVFSQKTAAAEQVQQQLVRENLPKQSGLDKLVSLLSQTQTRARHAIDTLPIPVKQQIQKLITQLPTPTLLKTSQGLKSAMRDSGLFLEAKLLGQVTAQQADGPVRQSMLKVAEQLAPDLKANLLQLARVIKASPDTARSPLQQTHSTIAKPYTETSSLPGKIDTLLPQPKNPASIDKPVIEFNKTQHIVKQAGIDGFLANKIDIDKLGKLIEASIARIETSQARSVVTDNNPIPQWSFEIPVKDKKDLDLLKLELEQRRAQENDDAIENWTVRLRIEFEGMGSLSAKVSMYDGDINIAVWSEHADIDALISSHLEVLGEQMTMRGLGINTMQHLQQGPADEEIMSPQTNLINITL